MNRHMNKEIYISVNKMLLLWRSGYQGRLCCLFEHVTFSRNLNSCHFYHQEDGRNTRIHRNLANSHRFLLLKWSLMDVWNKLIHVNRVYVNCMWFMAMVWVIRDRLILISNINYLTKSNFAYIHSPSSKLHIFVSFLRISFFYYSFYIVSVMQWYQY